MVTEALESTEQKSPRSAGMERERPIDELRRTARLGARMRRCLILRQGASPLRPPAPFPWFWIVRSEADLSRVRFAG